MNALKTKAATLLVFLFSGAVARPAGFTVLHPFSSATGNAPFPALLLISNNFYGATVNGGSGVSGVLYKVNPDGTGYTNFYNFTAQVSNTNKDGAYPRNLVLSGHMLYGATGEGGPNGVGTLFRVNTDGTEFTNIYTFSRSSPGSNGYFARPILLSGNVIYGTTSQGGNAGKGTLYRINPDGTGITNLLNFQPQTLLAASNVLYGTTASLTNSGTIFTVNTNGTGFSTLYTFTPLVSDGQVNTNSDGAFPSAFIWSGNTFYGTTTEGGANGNGTIFKVNNDGTGFTTLYSFTATPPYVPGSNTVSDVTNSDGASPDSLILSGSVLFGGASGGGTGGVGTLFQINTDGTGFTNLYNMGSLTWYSNVVGTTTYVNYTNADGLHPAGLLLVGRTVYGTAESGGAGNGGTFFSFGLPAISLNRQFDGTNLILNWSDSSCCLQSAPTPIGPWTDVSGAACPYTNPVSGPAAFFRLRSN